MYAPESGYAQFWIFVNILEGTAQLCRNSEHLNIDILLVDVERVQWKNLFYCYVFMVRTVVMSDWFHSFIIE